MQKQLERQLAHWSAATSSLQDLSRLAAPEAWSSLGAKLGHELRHDLLDAVARLRAQLEQVRAADAVGCSASGQRQLEASLQRYRRSYLRVETTLDFFGDAINTRTTAELGELLRACDVLARRSMEALLVPMGLPVPFVLTYLDRGLGAKMLKAELPLWDPGTRVPVAVIQMTRHALLRPTSLLHEAGHQVAHQLGWTPQIRRVIEGAVADPARGQRWAAWASEIVADLYAFVHTGFAAVSALHDVVAAEPAVVTQLNELDPHPPGWLRVLLGCAMCRTCWGRGPWDELERDWRASYPLAAVAPARREALARAAVDVEPIAAALLSSRYPALGHRRLPDLVDPARISPAALRALEVAGGAALFVSSEWVERECLRLLALSGFKLATDPSTYATATDQQRAWMHQLARVTGNA